MSNTVFSEGLFEFMDSYDGFIIDQWGVLHNGIKPYPGVLDLLKKLKQENKQVVVLSNSGKRASYNLDRMKELGFGTRMFKAVVSAGEVTWQGLKNQEEGIFKDLGKKCYLISRAGEKTLTKDLDIELVEDIEDAEFILITGTDSPEKKLEDYEAVLKKAVAKGLHAICANPDIVAVFGSEKIMGPGALAQRYREFGGVAHMIGKPHSTIFKHCLSLFDNIMPARVLMIGDSLYHDIGGAISLDIDSAFITSGIHAHSFKNAATIEEKLKNVNQLGKNYGIYPKWAMDSLIWQTPEAKARMRERLRMRE